MVGGPSNVSGWPGAFTELAQHPTLPRSTSVPATTPTSRRHQTGCLSFSLFTLAYTKRYGQTSWSGKEQGCERAQVASYLSTSVRLCLTVRPLSSFGLSIVSSHRILVRYPPLSSRGLSHGSFIDGDSRCAPEAAVSKVLFVFRPFLIIPPRSRAPAF